jgi:hypothetical protein
VADRRSHTNHEWSYKDNQEVCSCGARRCTATRLNAYSKSVRCRGEARDGSTLCKRHAYLDRLKTKQQSTPAP